MSPRKTMTAPRLALVAACLFAAACTSSVSNLGDGKTHDCVGLNDDKDSTLVYKYSTRNIVVGLLTMEFLAPPVVVVLNELQCPTKIKETK